MLFEDQVAKTPDSMAVVNHNKTINYLELNQKANQFANYLKKHIVTPNPFIAICMDRSIDLFVVILAILKVGGTYVPLDADHPEERLLYILNDNRAPILVIQSNLLTKFKDYSGQLITYDTEINVIAKESYLNLHNNISPHQLAYMIYTSGSTGNPKGVLIEHISVNNYAKWFKDYSEAWQGERIDFSANYTFDMSVSASIVPLLIGMTIVVCDESTKKNVGLYLSHLADYKINIIKITPSYFKVLLLETKNHFIPLPDLKVIILGGENLSSADCAMWLNFYPLHTLFNEYGPAEATVAVTEFKITNKNIHNLATSVPIGKPGPNMECYVLDENLEEVSELEQGELYIGGICLARGYLNLTELTKESFIESNIGNQSSARLYKTGDVCKKLANGLLEFIGRIDSQIKIRGFRVEIAEIEKHCAAHPEIEAARVIVREDKNQEKRIIAYYVLKSAKSLLTSIQLRKYLRLYLPEYMIPAAFMQIDNIPLTANGKLDTACLPVPKFNINQQTQAPTTELEKQLTEIWCSELGVECIGLHDDFFELGGHSLSAARIISQIKSIFKKSITIQNIYTHTTIAKLIPLIQNEPVEILKTDPNKLSYINARKWPLSDFQLLLWLADIFEPKAKKLNIVVRKRIQGKIDGDLFKKTLEKVCKQHEVLFYKISRFRSLQFPRISKPPLCEVKLLSQNSSNSEQQLLSSIDELRNLYPWPKHEPMLRVRLFHLQNGITEIQLAVPHIVFDENSVEILLEEISRFYLFYPILNEQDKKYREYIALEQQYLGQDFEKDIIFWQEYLKDAYLFKFPQNEIVADMQSHQLTYSTYQSLDENDLNKLHEFSTRQRVSMHDTLCALLLLSLYNCCGKQNENTSIYLNIVKSTRHEARFDNTIGCFLRIEPIKILLKQEMTLVTLSQQVHSEVLAVDPYQQCSALVKLACIDNELSYSIKSYLLKLLLFLYGKFFCVSKLQQKILSWCGNLTALKKKKAFVININVQSAFVKERKEKNSSNWCGFKEEDIDPEQIDLLNIEQFFDAAFLRDSGTGQAFLVISANLRPEFRKHIAAEMIRIIKSEITSESLLIDRSAATNI